MIYLLGANHVHFGLILSAFGVHMSVVLLASAIASCLILTFARHASYFTAVYTVRTPLD